jgi:hypothetical protein
MAKSPQLEQEPDRNLDTRPKEKSPPSDALTPRAAGKDRSLAPKAGQGRLSRTAGR